MTFEQILMIVGALAFWRRVLPARHVNSASTAAGAYQFARSTWERVQ